MINCIIIDDDELSRNVLKKILSIDPEINVDTEFDNAISASNYLQKNNDIDLIFLDIEMPEMTGIEFVELHNENLPLTIFTTSHSSFAVKAFHYNICGYLVKPYQTGDLLKSINKAKAILAKNKVSNHFLIKQGSSHVKINRESVTLIECFGDYVNLYCGSKKYTVHATMKRMAIEFPEPNYIRTHRSYIINVNNIEEIEDDAILCGNKQIPIGKTYADKFYERFKSI